MTNLLQITEFHTLQAIKTVEIVSRLIKGDEKCIFATPTKQRRTARFCGLFHPWYILLFQIHKGE